MKSNNDFAKASVQVSANTPVSVANTSANQPAAASIQVSANIPASVANTSANQPVEVRPATNQSGFEGDYTNANALGFDSPDGVAFGIDEFGGIGHFGGITQPTITH